MTTHFFNTEDTLVTRYKHLSTREIIYFSTVLFSFIQTLNRVHILLLRLHIVRIVYAFRVFIIVTQCNNLIAENKIIITTSDSFHV